MLLPSVASRRSCSDESLYDQPPPYDAYDVDSASQPPTQSPHADQ